MRAGSCLDKLWLLVECGSCMSSSVSACVVTLTLCYLDLRQHAQSQQRLAGGQIYRVSLASFSDSFTLLCGRKRLVTLLGWGEGGC